MRSEYGNAEKDIPKCEEKVGRHVQKSTHKSPVFKAYIPLFGIALYEMKYVCVWSEYGNACTLV